MLCWLVLTTVGLCALLGGCSDSGSDPLSSNATAGSAGVGGSGAGATPGATGGQSTGSGATLGGRFAPPAGKTLLVIGQQLF